TIDVDVVVPALAGGEHVMALSLLREKGKWLPEDNVMINWRQIRVPKDCDPVTFELSARYVIRKVKRNAETIAESDDDVSFLTGRTDLVGPVELVTSEELASFIWHVVSPSGEELGFAENGGPLHFRSYDSATQFLAWLSNIRSLELAGRSLYLGLGKLRSKEIATLTVESLSVNGCKQ